MPVADEVKSSWADEVDEVAEDLPQPTEVFENGLKVVTEYKRNEDNKKPIALRKAWPKYGVASADKPGPNPANTVVGEDIFMQFITSREEQDKPDEDALDKLKSMADKTVKCRTCNGDHWTLKCPYKDTGYVQNKTPAGAGVPPVDDKRPGAPGATDDKGKMKYIPPGMRDGGGKRGETLGGRRHDDSSAAAIRISNISESTQESDLEELVKPFGDYSKLFLAKDKSTGLCKGFAYIHFKSRSAAAAAIATLHGHGYDHLILNAEWSKPQHPAT